MIDRNKFPNIIQSNQTNCIPATIEAIIRYHKPMESRLLPNQMETRELLNNNKLMPSFGAACQVLENPLVTHFELSVEDFQKLPTIDWKNRIIDLVENENLPVAFAAVLDNPPRIHIRAIIGHENNEFFIFDPGDGTITPHAFQEIMDDVERKEINVSNSGIDIGPCRDILIIRPLL